MEGGTPYDQEFETWLVAELENYHAQGLTLAGAVGALAQQLLSGAGLALSAEGLTQIVEELLVFRGADPSRLGDRALSSDAIQRLDRCFSEADVRGSLIGYVYRLFILRGRLVLPGTPSVTQLLWIVRLGSGNGALSDADRALVARRSTGRGANLRIQLLGALLVFVYIAIPLPTGLEPRLPAGEKAPELVVTKPDTRLRLKPRSDSKVVRSSAVGESFTIKESLAEWYAVAAIEQPGEILGYLPKSSVKVK